MQLQAFDALNDDLDDLKEESEGAARVFKNKMIEMNNAREVKTEINKQIAHEVEVAISQALKSASQKLSDLKNGKVQSVPKSPVRQTNQSILSQNSITKKWN